MRETAGNTRGFVACEERTVQAEKRAPGVAAANMYEDCGDEEKFREEGAQVVNSVVYGGIYASIAFPSVHSPAVTRGLGSFPHIMVHIHMHCKAHWIS